MAQRRCTSIARRSARRKIFVVAYGTLLYYHNGTSWVGLSSKTDGSARWKAPMWVVLTSTGTNSRANTTTFRNFEVVSSDGSLYSAPEKLRMRNQYHTSYLQSTIELFQKPNSIASSTVASKQFGSSLAITQEFAFDWTGTWFRATWMK